MANKKELLFSVTKKDLVFEYYNGTGSGGQNVNKNKTCCRIKHPPSGAIGNSKDHKSRRQNEKTAFKRLVNSKKFQDWIKLEAARVTGELARIEEKVEKELRNVRVDVKDENGKWVKEE